MTNHPTELIFKKSRKHFGIRFHCIQTNEYIARKYISFAIVESNNISIIIVFQILTIYSKYIIIVTKNKIDSTYRFIIMSGNHLDYEVIPDPTLPDNINKITGRGLYLMKTLSDELIFENGGSTVTLVFNL